MYIFSQYILVGAVKYILIGVVMWNLSISLQALDILQNIFTIFVELNVA